MPSQDRVDITQTLSGGDGTPPAGAIATIVDNSRLWPVLVIACCLGLAGFLAGLFATIYSIHAELTWSQSYRELERENRLAQLKIDEFRMALIAAGIDPNPHVPGEEN